MRRHPLTVVAVLACVLASVRAAPQGQPAQPAPPPAGQQPPTFKVEVNYVEIDAVVTDAQGRFVGDLSKDDFQVLEEGKPQTVTVFTRVDIPVEPADPPLFKASAVEPDVRSNLEPFNGRVFLLVLDDLQTPPQRTAYVVAAARQFVRRYVGANDLVAIVTTAGNAKASQEFTTSRARMLAAVDKFVGQKLRDAPDVERGFKARSTYASLKGYASYMGSIRGRRKALIWFGEGVDYNIDNAFASRDADVVRQAMLDAIAAATRENVTVYGVDPRGLASGLEDAIEISAPPEDNGQSFRDDLRRGQDSLRIVSDETGGFAVVNQNDPNLAFRRIIQDNSSYYVLGYYASNEKRDGRFRPVQIRVSRPGVTVRARKGYASAKGRPAAPAVDAGDRQMPAVIRDALASPIPAAGLGLSFFAAPFTGPAAKASLATVLEIDPAHLKFVEKDGTFNEDLDVHLLAIDANGKMQDGGPAHVPLKLSARSHDLVARNGIRITRRLNVPPGRYQIKVAVRESNGGAIGTVMQDLDVPDFSKGALQISGIALTSAAASRMPTANPDAGFKDVLPTDPAAVRVFPKGDTIALFAEVYDNQTSAVHRVAIATIMVADDGKVAFTAGDERSSTDLQGQKGGYGYTLKIPTSELAPGRYVLKIEARTLLSGGGTAAREVELRIR